MRPSLRALVIAFTLNGAAFAAFCLYITSDFMAGPKHRYLMTNEFDKHTQVTSQALAIRHSDAPDVVILGASLTVRCIESEELLADYVAERSGGMPLIYDMSADGQSTWEMAALVDRLRPRFDGVLVLGVSFGQLSLGLTGGHDGYYSSLTKIADNPRFGITSEAFDNEARLAGLNVPYRTGVYALDNINFLVARRYAIARNLIKGPPTNGDPLNAPWVPHVNRPEYWQKEIAELPKKINHYESNVHTNLEVIGRFIRELKTRGDASFILLEPPINPGWYSERTSADFFKRYHNDLRRFAAEHGMSFLPISKETALLPTDFVDYEGHIGTRSARERCTKTLASRVSEVLEERHTQSR